MSTIKRGLGLVVAGLLACIITAAPLLLADVVTIPGSVSTSTVTIGTTPISGGATTQLLFNLAGVVSSDADLTFATDTLTATKLSVGGAPTAANAISIQETAGQITFEGATSNTIQTRLGATDPTGGDQLYNLPNLATGTHTLAVIDVDNAFTTSQTIGLGFNLNMGTLGGLLSRSSMTPDAFSISVGTGSNSFHVLQGGDANFDFQNGPCGTSTCTDPVQIFHSRNQDTQEWLAISHDGTAGVIQAANSTQKSGEIKLGRTVALTEAGGAETVITITTATTQSFGLELSYQVRASDATPDYAIREGSLKLVCVNNATTVTCTKDATTQADDESVLINTNSKTLTYAIAVNVATANTAILTWDIDSDMTVTAAEITFTAVLNGSGVIS